MRILVLGAGALGGYYGARLLAAGRDVTFLVRPARAALLAAHGLKVTSFAGDLNLPAPPTVSVPEGPYDLILFGCKAYDLESAMEAIAPAVGPGTAILPMLNGMAHLAALDERFGAEHVLGGACLISATLDAEGGIHVLGDRDILTFGERGSGTPQMAAIVETMANAGFRDIHHPNVMQAMWDKWCFLATLAGSTCLMRANLGEMVEAGAAPIVLALFHECLAIAEAEGHRPGEDSIRQGVAILTAPGSRLEGSMARDLEAGGRIETQQIIGDLLERGKRLEVAAPVLGIVYAHLRAYEVRGLRRAG